MSNSFILERERGKDRIRKERREGEGKKGKEKQRRVNN
jgi:hypothetical protein